MTLSCFGHFNRSSFLTDLLQSVTCGIALHPSSHPIRIAPLLPLCFLAVVIWYHWLITDIRWQFRPYYYTDNFFENTTTGPNPTHPTQPIDGPVPTHVHLWSMELRAKSIVHTGQVSVVQQAEWTETEIETKAAVRRTINSADKIVQVLSFVKVRRHAMSHDRRHYRPIKCCKDPTTKDSKRVNQLQRRISADEFYR